MKKLLFVILIIALPVMVQGQWYEGVKIGESIITDSVKPPKPMHDTLPVIMLVCDTIPYYETAFIGDGDTTNYPFVVTGDWVKTAYPKKEGVAFWLRGYEVRKYSFYLDSYTHVAYLDGNKQPVKYLVWDRKEVGK